MAARLIVRDVEDDVVRALTQAAVEHGRSIEAEHLEILRAALRRPRRRRLSAVLSAIPNVGLDEDFERCGP